MSAIRSWQELRLRLEAMRAAVAAEIRRYPPPIPACDAQFNHLTAQRRLLGAELDRLDQAAGAGTITVGEFLETSPFEAALTEAVRDG